MTLRYDPTTRDILSPDNMIVATVSGIFHRADPALGYEMAAAKEMVEALTDMLAGWRYIRQHHGELYGVDWDRCEKAASVALERAKP